VASPVQPGGTPDAGAKDPYRDFETAITAAAAVICPALTQVPRNKGVSSSRPSD